MSSSQSLKNACTKLARKIRVRRSKGMDPIGYEKTCSLDSDVKRIDENFMHHTKSIFNIFTNGVAGESGFSFQSLKALTGGLLEIDRAVVDAIFDFKEDICGDKYLFEIVKGYFIISQSILELCQVIHKYIKDEKSKLLWIQYAIALMPEDTQPITEDNYNRILDNLNKFMNADNPFPEEFSKKLKKISLLQTEVKQAIVRMNKKLKRVKGWLKISSIIWGGICATAVAAAVLAAVMSAGVVAAGLGVLAVVCVPLLLLCRWLGIESERELNARLVPETQTRVLTEVLSDIKRKVYGVLQDVESVEKKINSVREGGDACPIRTAMQNISDDHVSLLKGIKGLEDHLEGCSDLISESRKRMLEYAVKVPAMLPPPSRYKLSL